MELRSERWQIWFAAGLFGFILFMLVSGLLQQYLQSRYGVAAPRLPLAVAPLHSRDAPMVVVLVAVFAYMPWHAVTYRMRADCTGVSVRCGFTRASVRWDEVESYYFEQVSGTKQHLVEPVLRGRDGAVLLRPVVPPFICSEAELDRRAAFWQAVTKAIRSGRWTGLA